MKQLRLYSLIIFGLQRIRREAYVWITLSHDHILPFLGITMRDDFARIPALVSPWMENRSLGDYLKRTPQLPDCQKLELVGVSLLRQRQFILSDDFRYNKWLLVFIIVRPIRSNGII